MGKYDRRIAVLRNLRGGTLDLGDQRLCEPTKGANFEQKASSSPQR